MKTHTDSVLSRWRIWPKVEYVNFRKSYPNAGEDCWSRWFSIDRYWMGQLIYITVKHHTLIFDFRRNWVEDMKRPSR